MNKILFILMATYVQYQSVRAMRDALGNQMVSNIQQSQKEDKKDPVTEIKRYKELLDVGAITQEE